MFGMLTGGCSMLSLRVEELHDEPRQQKESNEALLRKISQSQDVIEVRLRDLERQLNPALRFAGRS